MMIVRSPNEYPLNTLTRSTSEELDRAFKLFLNNLDTNSKHKFIKDKDVPIPAIFEGRKQWASYISNIKNQGTCGGCYAFASAAALADRFNLLSQGQLHINLSASKMIACDIVGKEVDIYGRLIYGESLKIIEDVVKQFGCSGNTLLEAWRFLYDIGTNTVECVGKDSYNKSCTELVGPLLDTCGASGGPAVFYKSEKPYVVPGVSKDGGSQENIKRNIYIHGPVTTAMVIYEDFYSFDPLTEIYIHKPGLNVIGGHAVVIDGWGEENGIPFWWVRNSWGKEWGLEGYFKIRRGNNCCDIEENVFVAPPALEKIGTIDPEEKQAGILDLDKLGPIRRTVMSTFIPSGGIDPRTGISRRYLSLLEYSDFPEIRRTLPTPPTEFIAGKLGQIESYSARENYSGCEKQSNIIWFFIAIMGMVILIYIVLCNIK